jgi:hypothetical protein
METVERTRGIAGTSPRSYARFAGVLYLILLFCGPFSMLYVPSTIIVPGDATATARNLVASEALFRAGLVSDAIIFLTEIALVAVLYVLFRPVSRTLSLVAAFARLAMATVQGVNLLGNFTALLLVSGAGYLAAFEPGQLHALTLLSLDVRAYGVHVWEAFFALHCLVLGYLIFRSGFLPRPLGVLMAVAAVGYLANSLGNFVAPGYRGVFALVVAVTAMVGELPFLLWLLINGVNVQEWYSRAFRSP